MTSKRKLEKMRHAAEALRYRADRAEEYRERRKRYLLAQAAQMGQAKQLEERT